MTKVFSAAPAAFLLLIALPLGAQAQAVFYDTQAAFSAVSSTVLVEDFESVTPKDTGLSSFTHNGILYTGLAGNDLVVASPGYTNFGVQITTSSILTSNNNEDFLLSLGTARQAIGFDTYVNTFGAVRVEAFGASGSLGSHFLGRNAAQAGFVGITSVSEAITSVRWTGVRGDITNTGIDNVRVGNVTVAAPEPSALALLLLPFASAAYCRRTRSQGGSD